MRWALIENGEVCEITDTDPTGRFHPDLEWRECGPDVREGWVFDGQDFAPPEALPTPVPSKISMRQLLIGLKRAKWITPAQADAWSADGTLPPTITAVIDALPTEDERVDARITARKMSDAYRNDALLFAAARAAMPGATEQEVNTALDQAFRDWSKL